MCFWILHLLGYALPLPAYSQEALGCNQAESQNSGFHCLVIFDHEIHALTFHSCALVLHNFQLASLLPLRHELRHWLEELNRVL